MTTASSPCRMQRCARYSKNTAASVPDLPRTRLSCPRADRASHLWDRTLARVATRRLVRFVGRMLTEGTQRLARQLIESDSPRVHLRHELLAHLGAPETPDVIGDAGDRLMPWLGAKEIPNIVRHMYQMLCAAHGFPLRTRVDQRKRSLASTSAKLWSSNAIASSTSASSITSGGMKRTVLCPHDSKMRPLWYARVIKASQSFLAGSLLVRSFTNSTPIISPLPRTSPTTANLSANPRSLRMK